MTTGNESQDARRIEETLRALERGFRRRDADMLRDVYAEDADWTNAFGTTLSGRDAIVSYLRGLFADRHFAAGRVRGEPQYSARPAGNDAVVVKTYVEIEGQETADGQTLPIRRNHSLKVLVRAPDGRWLILSEMYMDARTETTYGAH